MVFSSFVYVTHPLSTPLTPTPHLPHTHPSHPTHTTQNATIRYRQLHPGFEGSRELKLITVSTTYSVYSTVQYVYVCNGTWLIPSVSSAGPTGYSGGGRHRQVC